MDDRILKIRDAEAKSHIEAYSTFELYSSGSWLAKPVKTVMEILPCFAEYRNLRVLDLGSGVGRNAIAIAKQFLSIECHIECVDILEMAIAKLMDNADKYGIADRISGIVSSIDAYQIRENHYDFILAVSALEHICSEEAFLDKLLSIKNGLRTGGVACFIVNSGVQEWSKESGDERVPQFEVNLPTDEMLRTLETTFLDWEVLKQTVVHQTYDIPRETGMSLVHTDVVTYVVRKH